MKHLKFVKAFALALTLQMASVSDVKAKLPSVSDVKGNVSAFASKTFEYVKANKGKSALTTAATLGLIYGAYKVYQARETIGNAVKHGATKVKDTVVNNKLKTSSVVFSAAALIKFGLWVKGKGSAATSIEDLTNFIPSVLPNWYLSTKEIPNWYNKLT